MEPTDYTAQDDQADELMEMMADHNLRLLLPSGTITYPTATGGTTIDLVWGNEKAEENLLKCQISKTMIMDQITSPSRLS